MAVRDILKGFGASASSAATAAAGAGDAALRFEVLDDFEQAGIGWIWASDAEGKLIYLSEGAFAKIGLPANEVLGEQLVSLFEIDPENPDEKSDRPLNFQLNSRGKIHDLVVRMAYARAAV